MLLFNKKLLAAKKLLEDDEVDSDMGSSMVEGQKQAINTLSKHEKLLLLELQKTRLSIVDELQQLDPAISADAWKEVQGTISTYQRKITSTAAEESIDGQRVMGKFNLPGDPYASPPKVRVCACVCVCVRACVSRSLSTSPPLTLTRTNPSSPRHAPQALEYATHRGSSGSPIKDLGAHSTALHGGTGTGNVDNYSSVTGSSRTKLVNMAAQVPVSRLRTGVDMLPVLSTVGLTER